MKKIILSILTFFATTSLVFGASNLWEYHKEKGLKFPSFEERKDFYESKIGEPYIGTIEQNNKYLNSLENPIKLGSGLGSGASVWFPTQNYLKPVSNSWGLQVPGLATSTNGCLSVNSSGWISASGSLCASGTFSWTPTTNYGASANATATPIWFQSGLQASSTSRFVYASTTALTVSGNSYLGTVSSGAWNGSSIGDSYIDDTITLTNLTQVTNRAISDTTGTLTVGRGGTGQTSFSQGWLNSDGAVLSASTSPTVNYITATSTTATSTFANGLELTGGCFKFGGSCLTASAGTITSIATTFPVLGGTITTTGTLSFGGLSTSTAAVVGNLPYFSGVNTFANVATTTLTASSPLSLSQPISVIGSSASALTISTAGDWTGTIDSNNFAGGAIGAGELIYGGSAGSFSELALGTNGYVLALSGGVPAWVATTTLSTISGTLDISSQSNLAVTAPVTLTGDTLSLGTVTMYPAFTYATSSAWTGTTTIPLAPAYVAETWNGVKCFTDAGTLNVSFYDGTNRMDMLNASTTVGTFTLSSNNSFISGEKRYVDIGTPASSPAKISCSISKTLSIN